MAELDLLTAWTARRQAIAARYSAALAGSWLAPPSSAPGRQHAFFNYMVKAPDEAARRDLENRMRAARIQVVDAYTVVADQELYRCHALPCRVASLDVARTIAGLLVPIPCYPELSEAEIERIEAVLSFR